MPRNLTTDPSRRVGVSRRFPVSLQIEWAGVGVSFLRQVHYVALFCQLSAGCAQSPPREVSPVADSAISASAGESGQMLSGDQSADRARLDSLISVARSLARTEGCSSTDGCATMALGAKACGGPREYLVYCRASTDTVALAEAVERLNSMERSFNERYQLMSDCMMLMEPGVALQGGSCVASREGIGRMP